MGKRQSKLYVVEVVGQPDRLIRAYSRESAMKFAYRICGGHIASQLDLERMLKTDPVEVEDATDGADAGDPNQLDILTGVAPNEAR